MSLLKGQQQPAKPSPPKPQPAPKPATRPAALRVEWPEKRQKNGLGTSFKDGFWFGLGFWIALIVGMPIIGFIAGVVIFILLAFIGGAARAF